MTTDYYTHVSVYGGKILYRGVDSSGRKRKGRLDYSPPLFVPSAAQSEYRTIRGDMVSLIRPGSIKEARDFVKLYDGVPNYPVYGMQRYEYSFIAENFPGQIQWDKDKIDICNIDIEVGSENGFPDPALANEPVTAITMKDRRGFKVFGTGEFKSDRQDVSYLKCHDELDLLRCFLSYWETLYPDAMTGWNIKFFDIPYLVNRITKLFGDKEAKKLSPFGILGERTVVIMGKEQRTYLPVGIGILDYIELYKKFAPGGQSQESYRLDAICSNELKLRKLNYEEYGNLHTLYRRNYQLFIEYNIRDVELVEKLDDKLKLIDLALTLAYDSKSNYDDVFAQVRMWDSIIYNYLLERNIVIPPSVRNSKDEAFIGAYVKTPLLGLHKWVVSFDLNSLYPHLIMQYNISPDCIIDANDYTSVHRSILSQSIGIDQMLKREVDTKALKQINATLTPNAQLFDVTKKGFLTEIMQTMYDDRSAYKKKALAAKKELQEENDPAKRNEIEKKIARFNNMQLVKKVCLNSAYGALGNEFFRHFDIRQATAITSAGQLSIRWIENRLNEYLNKVLKTGDHDYVIASDTDSIYLCLDRLVSETILKTNPTARTEEVINFMDKLCEEKIQPFIDKCYRELAEYTNALENKMFMKREALASKGIWTAKKRYILNVHDNEGVRYSKPDIKVMGLEMVRSSTPGACRVKLKEVIDIIINQTEEDVFAFVKKFRAEFLTLPEAEIAFPRGINGLEKYSCLGGWDSGTPIHVKGAILYNNLIKTLKLEKDYPAIKEGEKIKFIYLKKNNPLDCNVISFPQVIPKEFDLAKYIDYNTQFEKSFVEPLKGILDVIGWHHEPRNTLDQWFA